MQATTFKSCNSLLAPGHYLYELYMPPPARSHYSPNISSHNLLEATTPNRSLPTTTPKVSCLYLKDVTPLCHNKPLLASLKAPTFKLSLGPCFIIFYTGFYNFHIIITITTMLIQMNTIYSITNNLPSNQLSSTLNKPTYKVSSPQKNT